MAYNNIPLALDYDGDTGNAKGLIEFTLSSTDLGDICSTAPDYGQVLVWSSTGVYCPSTLPPPGSFTGNLSDVGQVCNVTPLVGQALVWSGVGAGSIWCPSTVGTGGGGGSLPTGAKDTLLWNGSEGINWAASAPSDVGIVKEEYENVFTQTNTFQAAPIIQTTTEHPYARIGAASALSAIVSPGANSLLAYGGGNTPETIESTAEMLTFLGTSADLSSLRDVSGGYPNPLGGGTYYLFQWDSGTSEFVVQPFKDSFEPPGTPGDNPFTTNDAGQIVLDRFYSAPAGITGKGDLSTGFLYVSGTSSTQTTTKYASTFGQAFISGSPILGSDVDRFLYLSANGGQHAAAGILNSNAKNFLVNGNAGAGQLDHGALSGLGDNDHPQYLLSAAAITDHGALGGLGDNDHPQYVLSATNNVLSSAYTNHAASASVHFTEGSIDHGSIAGLGDNDHPQYLLSAAAITDHGALAGLGDNDHPQYRLSATLITNAAMATMGAATVKGSVGGGTPADLSMTQLQSIAKVKLRTPFHSDGGEACQLGAHPSTEQFLKNLNINMQIADLSTYSQVRMFCRIYTNSGSSNSPRLIAKFHTSYTTTVGTFSDIGTSEVSTSLASYTLANSGWVNLADGAMIDDCYITVTQIGGDSSATPRISSLFMEFR